MKYYFIQYEQNKLDSYMEMFSVDENEDGE